MSVKCDTKLLHVGKPSIELFFISTVSARWKNLGVWAPLDTGTVLAFVAVAQKGTSQSIKESRVPAAQQGTQPGKGQTDGRRWEETPGKRALGRMGSPRREGGKTFAGRSRRKVCQVAERAGKRGRGPRPGAPQGPGRGDGDPGPGDGGPPAAEPRYLTICRAAAGTGPGSRPPPPPG